MSKSQVVKGKAWEQEVVRLFRTVSIELRRNGHLQRRKGGSSECPDLENDEWAIECGRGKQVNLRAKLQQAIASKKPLQKAAAVTKDDRKEALITMTLQDFLSLMIAIDFVKPRPHSIDLSRHFGYATRKLNP